MNSIHPEMAYLKPFGQFSMIFNRSFTFFFQFLINFSCDSMGISHFFHFFINFLCYPIKILQRFLIFFVNFPYYSIGNGIFQFFYKF